MSLVTSLRSFVAHGSDRQHRGGAKSRPRTQASSLPPSPKLPRPSPSSPPSTNDGNLAASGAAADDSLRLERTLHRLEHLVSRARLATAGSAHAAASSSSKPSESALRLRRKIARRNSHESASSDGPTTVRVARFASLSADRARASEEEAETASLMRTAVDLLVEDERHAYDPARVAAGEGGGCLFGQFCEGDGLGMLVDVASGRAFDCLRSGGDAGGGGRRGDDAADGGRGAAQAVVLAPPAVATEALACISYLVRNVVEPMTLTFILSNRKLRGLLADWDVSLYDAVEDWGWEATAAPDASAGFKKSGSAGSSPEKRHRNPVEEISAKFVALLCSMAERLSADTIQFFLATKMIDGEGGDDNCRLETTFPLYERALQFCSRRDVAGSGDGAILRLSAAKVCTDVVKLVTSSPEDGAKSDESVCLSLGRKLDMARCVCHPEHVKSLVGTVVDRISDLLDALQWTVREVDARNASDLGSDHGHTTSRNGPMRPSLARMPSEVCRLKEAAGGILADIEVEIILLDDVLSASLTFLNEQIVDLFLCTFVHRLLPKLDLLGAYEYPAEGTSAEADGKVSTLLPVFQTLQKAAKADPIDPSRWSRDVLDLLFREKEEKESEFGIKSIEWSGDAPSSSPSASSHGVNPLEASAAAKAALLVAAAVFCTIKHKPLVHLLFVSLFNADMPAENPPPLPLLIDTDDGPAFDDAIASKRRGEIRTDNDGVLCYDFDRHRKRKTKSSSGGARLRGSSSPNRRVVGRGEGNGEKSHADRDHDGSKEQNRGRVVELSLAPAFTDVFRGAPLAPGGQSARAPNRHRRAVAAYLAGKEEGQLRLRPFATLAARAALTAVAGGKGKEKSRAKMKQASSSSRRRADGGGSGQGKQGRSRRGGKSGKPGRTRKEGRSSASSSSHNGKTAVPEKGSGQMETDQQCAPERANASVGSSAERQPL